MPNKISLRAKLIDGIIFYQNIMNMIILFKFIPSVNAWNVSQGYVNNIVT